MIPTELFPEVWHLKFRTPFGKVADDFFTDEWPSNQNLGFPSCACPVVLEDQMRTPDMEPVAECIHLYHWMHWMHLASVWVDFEMNMIGIRIYSPSVSHKHAPSHSTMGWEAISGYVSLLHRSRDRHGRCRERLGARYLKIWYLAMCKGFGGAIYTVPHESHVSVKDPKKMFKLLHFPRHILLHGLHGRQYRQLRWGCFRCFPFCHSCDLGFLAEAPQQTLCLKCIYPHGQSRLKVNLFQWTWSTDQCLQPNCLGSLGLG